MISGHDARRVSRGVSEQASLGPLRTAMWVLGVLLPFLALRAAPAAADDYVVVLVQPDENELVTRVKGQTRDLGVRVVVIEEDSAERTAAAEARLADDNSADFLARIERTAAGTLEVRVFDARQRTLRARSVPAPVRRDRLASSAELEAAALVLRGEVTALIEARQLAAQRGTASPAAVSGGTSNPTTAPSPAPAPPAVTPRPQAAAPPPRKPSVAVREPEPEEDEEEEPEEPEEEEEDIEEEVEDEEPEEEEPEEPEPPSAPLENYSARSRTWTLRGGLRASVPVEAPLFGLFAGGRLQFGWFEVGAAVSTSLPVELYDENIRIRLRRHALTAEAFGVLPWGPRLRVLLGVEAGAVLYSRSTEFAAAGYEARDPRVQAGLALGLQAELQWLLERHWGLALGAGLSYLTPQTRFEYTALDENQPNEGVGTLHSVEPLMCVSLFGLFGP